MDFPNFFPTTITLQYFMFHRVLLRCVEVEVHTTQVDVTLKIYAFFLKKGQIMGEKSLLEFHL